MEHDKTQARITIAIVMISAFITPFMTNAINLAIPSIGLQFGGSQSLLNWVVSGFLISCASFLLPFGRLADQFGRRKIFLTGMACLALSSLACALAPSLAALVFFRVLQGLSGAMIFSTATAILTSVVPPQSRGKALGLHSAATYIGLSSGPALGGFLTSQFTWRGVFFFILLMSALVFVLTVWKLKGEWKGSGTKIDGLGIVLCIAVQTLILFGLTDLTSGALYQLCFVVGILLLIVFALIEKKLSEPLVPVGLMLSNKPFSFSCLAALINYSATFALTYVMSLFLQTAMQIDTATSGLVLLVQPIMMAAFSPLSGSLSDRIQPAILSSLGMGISALGLFFFIFISPQTSIVLIILDLAFIGFGLALFAAPNTNAIMSSVDRAMYGFASSIMGNMRLLGQAISMAIVSLITSIMMRDLTIDSSGYVDRLMVSLKFCFTTFALLCVLGLFASMVRGKISREPGED